MIPSHSKVSAPASWTAPVLWCFSRVRRASESCRGLPHSKALRGVRGAALCLLLALFVQPSTLRAQPATNTRVLDLDGTNGLSAGRVFDLAATPDVARILGKHGTSREQIVAEVRKLLTHQLEFHI